MKTNDQKGKERPFLHETQNKISEHNEQLASLPPPPISFNPSSNHEINGQGVRQHKAAFQLSSVNSTVIQRKQQSTFNFKTRSNSKAVIQRQESTTRPASTRDYRDLVEQTIRHWTMWVETVPRITISYDEAFLQRMLDQWRSMRSHSHRIIATELNGDTTLLNQLQGAYQQAIEAIVGKAARDLGRAPQELYTQFNLSIARATRNNLATRENIVFILGNPRGGDNFYRAAQNHFQFNNANIVNTLRSLVQVRDYLAGHAPSNGLPWGEVSIVVHANLEGQMAAPLVGNSGRVTTDNLRTAINNRTFQAINNNVIDGATNIVIRGCALGRNQEILTLLRSGFGGNDQEQPQVYAPKHLQAYEFRARGRRRRRRVTGTSEFFVEFWYVGFPANRRMNNNRIARALDEKYPGENINWRNLLGRRGGTRRQNFTYTFRFEGRVPRLRTQAQIATFLDNSGFDAADLEEGSNLTAADFSWRPRRRGTTTVFTGTRTIVRVQRELREPDPERQGRTRRVAPNLSDRSQYGAAESSPYD